jgi:hypothetical protein
VTTTNLSTKLPSGDTLQVLKAPDALSTLESDLRERGPVHAWVYLVDPNFFRQLFLEHLTHSEIFFLIDNRQARFAKELVKDFKNLHCWTWSYNRTLHVKTFLFPALGLTWIASHNLTLGSYNMSYNHAVRIHSPTITADLLRDWHQNQQHSKIVPRKNFTGQTTP